MLQVYKRMIRCSVVLLFILVWPGLVWQVLASPLPDPPAPTDNILQLCEIRNRLILDAEGNADQIRLLEKDALKVNLKLEDCDTQGSNPWDQVSKMLESDNLTDGAEEVPDLDFENVPIESLSESECTNCTENSADNMETFTSTLDDSSQSKEEKVALAGIIAGGIAMVVFVGAVLIGVIIICVRKCA